MTLSRQVLQTVRAHGLLSRGGRVAVALSGGPDSVALVHLLRELHAQEAITLAGVAHFNHQLRGAEADEDEGFCRSLAQALDLPIEIGRADVRQLARDQNRSVEDAARVARYAFLDEAADRLSAEAVAVAHSRDDQAETFLLRLIRGSGPRGLAGILPRAGRVVRPLLEVSRAELRQYLAERLIPFRDDSTNADLSIPRNRVRHELLPYLAREFSPGITVALAREAAIARADEDRLQVEALDVAAAIVVTDTKRGGRLEIQVAGLTSLHPALASRVARIALSGLAPGRCLGFDHLDGFLRFAREGRPGSALSLPGQQAVHRGAMIGLGPEPPRGRPHAPVNSFRCPLSIPGEVTLDWVRLEPDALGEAGDGWAITAEEVAGPEGVSTAWAARGVVVAVAAAPLRLPLAIRCRKAGDRFRPLGLGGRGKKLQDFLVDRRIPRERRDFLPLVVDRDDQIVWVVGESVAEDFRVTDPLQGVIFLKARRLGGPG